MNRTLELIRSRSSRFQLSSLMDLLLIIVFAQYLEFHRSSDAAKIASEQQIAAVQESLEEAFERQAGEVDQLRERLIFENRKLRQQRDQAVVTADEASRRQAMMEALIERLLNVDPEIVNRDLSPESSSESLEAAMQRADAIRRADSTDLLRFLAGYDELLKRAEIWTLHVSDRRDTELQPGSNVEATQRFRLEAGSQSARAEEFVAQMRAAYSQIPQPKGLVVILVSFSPRAIAGHYQPVLDAMPDVIEWLNKDAGGRTRFEYAVIGAITDAARDLPTSTGTDTPSSTGRDLP